MHLKYDNPIFRRVFIFGLILAVVVYAILASAFELLVATTTSSSSRRS